MKAQQNTVLAARHDFALRAQSLKTISKPKSDDGEIQACFSKLKDLVPTIPKERKLSKTQFLQHVIDYIFDLEVALECHPAMSKLLNQSMNNNSRLPLSECSRDNEQFLSKHTDFLEERACDRPVSC